MKYVYRFDNWMSHMQLAGAKLRAKHWSRKKYPDAHPHKTLIANEEILSPGQGLFRISFWKDEPTMLRWASSLSGTELIVMQRVRADHRFLQTFIREVDDCLPDSAWLYWQRDAVSESQRWSSDGIAKTDIDVLDYDGTWRRFSESEIMEAEERTFRKLGFEAYHYLYGGQTPATVFAKGQFVTLEGEVTFAILIAHPLCGASRVYNAPHTLKHVFHEVRRHAVDVPLANCRLFIMDDAKYTFELPHLAEVPLYECFTRQKNKVHLFGVIPIGAVEQGTWKTEFNQALRWHSTQSGIFSTIAEAFALPLQRDRIERAKRGLQRYVEQRAALGAR